jgi:trehalose 6-phosphate phosphatase
MGVPEASASQAATLAQSLEPLRSDPLHAAVLLDVDGTLAPIVEHAEEAHMSEAVRSLLIQITRRYGIVACVSGRRAQAARQIVAIGSISYIGNHGAELLAAGETQVRQLDPELSAYAGRVGEFARAAASGHLRALRVRFEDKGLIAAFHWRGAPDEEEALAALRDVATSAQNAGLAVHWGRKVLEIRPPVPLEKGRGITTLLGQSQQGENGQAIPLAAALYAGDDTTDVDAFRALRSLVEAGKLGAALCVAARSDEAPPELIEQADLVVEGPGGVRSLLAALLD